MRYKMLSIGAKVKRGDQFFYMRKEWRSANELVKDRGEYHVATWMFPYRRPITGNKSNAAQRAIKLSAGQAARRAPKKILDVCCGPRGMWFDKHNPAALFLDRRSEVHHLSYPSGNYTETIIPDQLGDFTDIQQPDNSFYLVVFDPPHISRIKDNPSDSGRIFKKYGILTGEWKEMLRKGFSECFRVLKPNGILVFKWNDVTNPISEILALTPEKPLFGHKVGKAMNTHWVCFMKQESPVLR